MGREKTGVLTATKNCFNQIAQSSVNTKLSMLFMGVGQIMRKQFVKGMEQIAQEGAIQIFKEPGGGFEEVIVGVVGVLQLEVLEHRLKTEYNVDIRMQSLPYQYIRWIENEEVNLRSLNITSDTKALEDFKERKLLLFTSQWNINWATEKNPDLKLVDVAQN